MRHLFIPYELAVIAKEKGFDEPCMKYFYVDRTSKWSPNHRFANRNIYDNQYNQPLYQQIIDWFREKHLIFINQSTIIGEAEVAFSVTDNNQERETYADTVFRLSTYHTTYYEALNKAITEAFKLI